MDDRLACICLRVPLTVRWFIGALLLVLCPSAGRATTFLLPSLPTHALALRGLFTVLLTLLAVDSVTIQLKS